MATRSRIGIQFNDGTILSAYHHWDGYPEWLGRILNTHYYDKVKASVLISGGDMSSCWTDKRWDDSADGTYGPQYYSQRGENVPPRMDKNLEEYLENNEEYGYLFVNDEWVCYDIGWGEEDTKIVKIPEVALAV
jgi:hypothetical protein